MELKELIWKWHRYSILLKIPNRYLPVQNQLEKQKDIVLNMPKQSLQGRQQVKCVKLSLLLWLLFNLQFIISVVTPCYFYHYTSVSTLIPCIDILISHFFLHFHLDSPHSRADSLHLHFHPIARIPTLILRISCIPFSNYQFWLLQIPCSVCIL